MRKAIIFPGLLLCLLLSAMVNAQNCSVNADVDKTICANEVMILNGQLTGSTPPLPVTLWSQISGPSVVITSPGSLVTSVTGFTGGNTYSFRLSTTCLDGAPTYDDVSFTVTLITTADAGPDATYCPGNGVGNLEANAPGPGESGSWMIIGANNAGVSVVDGTSPTSSINLAAASAGNTTLRWTITKGVCTSSDDVVITNCGGVSPVTAGSDQTLSPCFTTTTTATLAGSFDGNGTCGQTGQWLLISGPNNPTFDNVAVHNTVIRNLIPGTYTLRWNVSGTCVTGSDDVIITVPDPVGSVTAVGNLANQTFCDLRTTATLSGPTPLYINEVSLWSIVSKPSGATDPVIADPGNPVTQVTFTGAGQPKYGTYRFRYRITNSLSGCYNQDASVDIIFNQNPTLNAGPDQVLTCDANTTTLSGTQSGSGTPQYKFISYPSGYTPVSANWTDVTTSNIGAGTWSQTFTNLNYVGTYVVQFRKSSGSNNDCGTVFDDINILVSSTPTSSNPGSPQLLACNVDSTDLVGNVPTIGTGRWYQVAGPSQATLFYPHNNRTPITDLIPGMYRFRWLITGGPACPTKFKDTRVIVADVIPTAANAGPDIGLCYGTPYELQGNVPALNEAGTWEVSPSAGITFTPDVNSPDALVDGMEDNSSYRFIWTITNSCGLTRDTMYINTTGEQGSPLANAGADICRPSGSTTAQLDGNDPAPGTGTWTAIPSAGITFTPDANTRNAIANGLTDGTYKFVWAISVIGCTTTTDTVIVTVSEDVTTADAGPDQDVCGNSAILDGNVPVIGTGYWEQMGGPPGVYIDDPFLSNSNVSFTYEGTYTFYWTITNGACASSVDSVVFRIQFAPDAADAGEDSVYCNVTSLPVSMYLYATPVTNGTGTWTFVSGPGTPTIVTPNSPTSQLSNLYAGTYTLKWTVSSGPFCTPNTDNIQISVIPKAAAGADAGYCDISEILLIGNTGSTGDWTQAAGSTASATITTNGPNTAVASGLTNNNTYRFRYAITAGNCTSADTVEYVIYGTATPADAGIDQTYCQPILPVRDTFYLAGNTPAGGETGTWSVLSGPVTTGAFIPNANSPTAKFVPAGAGLPNRVGTYYFVWRIANGSCTSADQVKIVNYAQPSAAIAGSDIDVVCLDFAQMNATAVSTGIGFWSQVDGPAGPVIEAPYLPNTIISNLNPVTYPTSYKFEWSVSNGPCVVQRDTVSVTVYENPTEPDAGPDQDLCNVFAYTMQGNVISLGSALWTQTDGPATATITNPAEPNAYIVFPEAGSYEFAYTSSQTPCSLSDEVSITIYDLPSLAFAGNDQELCQFEQLYLSATPPVSGSGYWTQFSGPNQANILSPGSPGSQVIGVVDGIYRFVWTVSNGVCLSNSDTVNILIGDIEIPVFSCPDDLFVQCTAPAPYATFGAFTSAGGSATDNCGIDLASYAYLGQVSDGLSCPEIITRTYSIFDLAGNQATCTQTITINDITDPDLTVPALYSGSKNASCTISAEPAVTGQATATDNCDNNVSVTYTDQLISDTECQTVILRTWRAEDNCQNVVYDTQTLIFNDNTNPEFSFMPSAYVGIASAICTYNIDPSETGQATATDNCDANVSVTYTDQLTSDTDCQAVFLRTWRAEDNCGHIVTATQTLTYNDDTDPVFSYVPPAYVGTASALCTYNIDPSETGQALATDNCDATVSVTYTDQLTIDTDCQAVFLRTWKAEDNCGHIVTATQTLTYNDDTDPEFSFVPSAYIGSKSASCTNDTDPAVTGQATATDNCDATVSVTYTDQLTSETDCQTVILRTWKAEDNCGHIVTATQTLTYNDDTDPEFSFVPSAYIGSKSASCTYSIDPLVTGQATATDNCAATVSVTYTDQLTSDTDCQTVFLRTWKAEDNCGHIVTATQTLTFNDDTDPEFSFVPPAYVGAASALCTYNIDPSETGQALATDNCDATVSVTYTDQLTIDTDCQAVFLRTWKAEDNCGHIVTATQTLTYNDDTYPEFSFVPLAYIGSKSSSCTNDTDPLVTGQATATDNCDATVSVTFTDQLSSETDCQTVILRTWRAEDNCGHIVTTTQTLTYNDDTDPEFSFVPPAYLGSKSASCTNDTDPLVTGQATATDNCDATVSVTYTDQLSSETDCQTVILRTWRAEDNCGHIVTATQTLTYNDDTDPEFSFVPPDYTGSKSASCTYSIDPLVTGQATATDNCDATVSVTFTDQLTSDTDCQTVILRTWSAEDNCGHIVTATQTLTYNDDTDPEFSFVPTAYIGSKSASCTNDTDPAVTGQATATDNCDATVSVTYTDQLSSDTDCQTVILRTWKAEDNCGHVITATQTLTYNDDTDPEFSFMPSAYIGSKSALCTNDTDPLVTGQATATDNCDATVSVTYTDNVTSETDCQTVIQRTWKAEDNCGHIVTSTQTLTYNDDTRPVLACPSDITITCELPPAPFQNYAEFAAAGGSATDNCGINEDSFELISDVRSGNVFTRTYRIMDNCNHYDTCQQSLTYDDINVTTWVYLEGAAIDREGTGTWQVPMRTDLNELRVLPGQTFDDLCGNVVYKPAGQPYNTSPWNYPGTEGNMFDSNGDPSQGQAAYASSVVDWILVSLRETAEGEPLCQKAVLLHSNGEVEFVNGGFACCELDYYGSYYLVIEHRNHLIVMSDTAVGVNNGEIVYDFRQWQSYVNGNIPGGSGQKEILPGIFAMFAANGDQVISPVSDTMINDNDRYFWNLHNGKISNYLNSDYNLNGDTNMNDYIIWEFNRLVFSTVIRN